MNKTSYKRKVEQREQESKVTKTTNNGKAKHLTKRADRLAARRKAFDGIDAETQKKYKRPGSMKK